MKIESVEDNLKRYQKIFVESDGKKKMIIQGKMSRFIKGSKLRV